MTSLSEEHELNDLIEAFAALAPDAAALARTTGALRTITRRLAGPSGYDALKRLDRDIAKLGELAIEPGGLLASARDAAARARTWLDVEWEHRARDFAAESGAYFGTRGVTLRGSGLDIEAPPLAVHIEPEHDRASLVFAGEPVKQRIPLVPERLFTEWTRALARLERAQTAPDQLARELLDGYRDVCALRGWPLGRRVRLPDIHFQVFARRQTAQARQDPSRSRIKEYPRPQFAWDLGLLIASPRWHEVDDSHLQFHRASDSAAKSRSAAVTIRQPDGQQVTLGDLQVTATDAQ